MCERAVGPVWLRERGQGADVIQHDFRDVGNGEQIMYVLVDCYNGFGFYAEGNTEAWLCAEYRRNMI